MPIHEFHCSACEQDFESLIYPWESPGLECKLCDVREVNGVPAVTRKISLPAGHVWACSTDGAAPRKAGNAECARKEAKKDRVDRMTKKQLDNI